MVPQVKPSGDVAADSTAALQRAVFQKIIMRLEQNPNEILPTWGLMEAGATTSQNKAKSEGWDRTVASCGRFPKYWMAQWIVQNDSSPNPITRAVLDLIGAKDTSSIRNIFYLMTLTSASTP
eukprot:3913483-Lingulodinium_polyedra.AAC.1